jgi:hypothetical protein
VSASGDHAVFASTPHKVGVGAAIAAVRFATLCARTGKHYSLKVGEDLSFSDLRNQPAVIFGAFSSPWMIEINNEYRFTVVAAPDEHIVDSLNPSRQWRATPGRYAGTPTEDYAIEPRARFQERPHCNHCCGNLHRWNVGRRRVSHRTIPHGGTGPACSPSTRQGSFQVLLSTKVIGNIPTPARIVDTHFW